MKDYLGGLVDLTGDKRINPDTLDFGDGEGSHGRAVGKITSISIHHDASPRPHDYDSIARYVQEAAGDTARLGPGLPYHFRIDNTGVIFRTRPLTTWLNCVGSSENVSTLAVCLDGYFHAPYNEDPTREQYEALGQLLVNLCEQHPEFPATYPNVRPHRDFSQTACPGDRFAPWVFAIQSKADVLNIPASAVYDWPEYQTTTPPAPPTTTTTLPPVTPPVKTTTTTTTTLPPVVEPVPNPLPVPEPEPLPVPSRPSLFERIIAWLERLFNIGGR